jgi:hypothetical protein
MRSHTLVIVLALGIYGVAGLHPIAAQEFMAGPQIITSPTASGAGHGRYASARLSLVPERLPVVGRDFLPGAGWGDGAGLMMEPAPMVVPALSLEPETLPADPELILGGVGRDGASWYNFNAPAIPQLEVPGPFDALADMMDVQEVPGPLGSAISAHFHAPMKDDIGKWVPFVSILQDFDELDAHIRNGVGAGLTYRFNRDVRVDIEAAYLDKSGYSNPALGREGRVTVMFSFAF